MYTVYTLYNLLYNTFVNHNSNNLKIKYTSKVIDLEIKLDSTLK